MDLCEIDKSSTALAVSDSSQEVKYNIKKKNMQKNAFLYTYTGQPNFPQYFIMEFR